MREHGVAHRGGDREPVAERGDRPLDDHLGRGELELGADVGDQLAELLGRTALGVGALEVAGGAGGRGVIARLPRRRGPCRGGGSSRSSDTVKRAQARAALPGTVRTLAWGTGSRPRSRGSGRAARARSSGSTGTGSPRSRVSSARADPLGEGLALGALLVVPALDDPLGDVVGEVGRGGLQSATSCRTQVSTRAARPGGSGSLDLVAVLVDDELGP